MPKFNYRQIFILVIILIIASGGLFFSWSQIFTGRLQSPADLLVLSNKTTVPSDRSDSLDNYSEDWSDKDFTETLPINQPPIKLLFFGDLMLDRHVGEKIARDGLDNLFQLLLDQDFTNGYDLVLANLEGAVSNQGAHYLPANLYDFAFSPEIIEQLKNYNFNFFLLANNHLADQGRQGIIETYQNLSDLGFSYVGCQDAYLSPSSDFPVINLAANNSPPVLTEDDCSLVILEINNQRLAILAFSIVYKNISEDKILEKIRLAKEEVDWLIVSPHWGIEYQAIASQSQSNLAKKMIAAGADAIIGHHPHVIQNYETYQEKPIFYSLGNFIFDQYFSPETQEGLAVALNLFSTGEISWKVYQLKTLGSRLTEINPWP